MLAAPLLLLVFGFLIPSVGNDPNPQRTISRIAVLDEIPRRLELHRNRTGSYPSTAEGIGSTKPLPGDDSNRLLDTWGRPFRYRFPATRGPGPYDLWSLGPNPDDSEDDITNW